MLTEELLENSSYMAAFGVTSVISGVFVKVTAIYATDSPINSPIVVTIRFISSYLSYSYVKQVLVAYPHYELLYVLFLYKLGWLAD